MNEQTANTESTPPVSQNGKGDAPRNNLSDDYRTNYAAIDWSSKPKKKRKRKTEPYESNGNA